jgi:hypothetical protein
VNDAAFPNEDGYDEGTLLALAPQIEAINSPEPLLTNDGPNRLYNVTHNWLYYNPPQDPADEAGGVVGGHNLAPYNNGLFYQAETQNGGRLLYPTYNFYNLFAGAD